MHGWRRRRTWLPGAGGGQLAWLAPEAFSCAIGLPGPGEVDWVRFVFMDVRRNT